MLVETLLIDPSFLRNPRPGQDSVSLASMILCDVKQVSPDEPRLEIQKLTPPPKTDDLPSARFLTPSSGSYQPAIFT
jgi:hypothetical protein